MMKNKVYEVISTNIDINDGTFIHTLYANIEDAEKACEEELKGKDGTNIVYDLEGLLKEYDGKSLEYTLCNNRPAIYHRSYFGNYRMVVFIKTREVH